MEMAMIENVRTRRALSLTLVVLGGVLLFLAPEDIWIGVLLVALGLALEIVGALVGHPRR
jgi:apolipoprotein N-acyltransferase